MNRQSCKKNAPRWVKYASPRRNPIDKPPKFCYNGVIAIQKLNIGTVYYPRTANPYPHGICTTAFEMRTPLQRLRYGESRPPPFSTNTTQAGSSISMVRNHPLTESVAVIDC